MSGFVIVTLPSTGGTAMAPADRVDAWMGQAITCSIEDLHTAVRNGVPQPPAGLESITNRVILLVLLAEADENRARQAQKGPHAP